MLATAWTTSNENASRERNLIGRKNPAKQGLDSIPLQSSNLSQSHGSNIGRVVDMKISKWVGKLRLVTLGSAIGKGHRLGSGGCLSEDCDVVLFQVSSSCVNDGDRSTYENNVWSPATLATNGLEDVPVLCVWWEPAIDRLLHEGESKVILLSLGEAITVEDGILDTAEEFPIDVLFVLVSANDINHMLADGQGGLEQSIPIGDGDDIDTVPWVL